jgi:hypothetical protein
MDMTERLLNDDMHPRTLGAALHEIELLCLRPPTHCSLHDIDTRLLGIITQNKEMVFISENDKYQRQRRNRMERGFLFFLCHLRHFSRPKATVAL